MQRRSVLGVGVAGAALLALVGGGAALLHERAWRDGRLMPSARELLGAVARAVLDGSLPADAASRDAALQAHLTRMEDTISAMPPHTQRELSDLLAMLAVAPGRRLLAALAPPWADATLTEVQVSLQSMRLSSLLLRRQVYNALRDLTHAAYFSSASSWVWLGYPGPKDLP